eukprot:jgi/Tetstr1/454575/TSEL_041470.t1
MIDFACVSTTTPTWGNAPRWCTPEIAATEAEHNKLGADRASSAPVQGVHRYYPFMVEDRGRLIGKSAITVVYIFAPYGCECGDPNAPDSSPDGAGEHSPDAGRERADRAGVGRKRKRPKRERPKTAGEVAAEQMREAALVHVEAAHAAFCSLWEAPGHRNAAPRVADGQGEEDWVDYVALAEMKHTLFPKLKCLTTGASTDLFGGMLGGSGALRESVAAVLDRRVLLPARSRFLLSDMRRMQPLLTEAQQVGGYHLIVIDPPWENASARRSAAYATLPERKMLALPVGQLTSEDSALVALWVTNRPKLLRFVDEELLAAWGLTKVATWYWLKVTDAGLPVTAMRSPHRQPYEHLVLARRAGGAATPASAAPDLPQSLTIVSQPAMHSRKPRLGELLTPLTGRADPRCLELFARELEAGWTSWGNEVLRFQDVSLFTRRAKA